MVSLFTCFSEVWVSVFIFLSTAREIPTQEIVGCPIFGCTPGGSFAFKLRVPSSPALVKWKSSALLEPLHNTLGCVGNGAGIVCPVLTRKAVGYGSFSCENGSVAWEDDILHHPPLPLMDIFGDIIGSDGEKLLQYRADGTVVPPVINLIPSMMDIFSLNLADNGILLLTSSSGVLTTYFTNGVPGGTITMRYKVNNVTGTFCPVATPVIQGHRSYVLALFRADNSSSQENGLVRLFGIDLNDQFVGKIQLVWSIDLSRRKGCDVRTVAENRLDRQQIQTFQNSAPSNGSLLVHDDMIFVTLPLSNDCRTALNESDFWAVRDSGKQGIVKYSDFLSIDDLSLYNIKPAERLNVHTKDKVSGAGSPRKGINKKISFQRKQSVSNRHVSKVGRTILWGSHKLQGKITGFDLDRVDVKIITEIDLSFLLKASARITSKIMTVRNDIDSSDSIVFGARIMNKTVPFSNLLKENNIASVKNVNFVVCVTTGSESPPLVTLRWILPVPEDGSVSGQLVGIPSEMELNDKAEKRLKDSENIIVGYAVGENSANVFAIH